MLVISLHKGDAPESIIKSF